MIKPLIAALLFSAAFALAAPKKIVLIAGPITGHPKDTHEYEKNVTLLKHLLDQESGKFIVEAHYRGWPTNAATLNDADSIFFTSDGTDRTETNHPLYVGDHLKVIETQMKRGCGLIFFHWSTFHPKRYHDQITEWVGGYFDYESGPPPRNWYSAIQTWNAEAIPQEHPITRGVKPFRVEEEFYYRIRFRENDSRLKSAVITRPPNEKQDFAVGWAVERKDGGRGFGFTGGHFYKNWWSPDFRKLVLNAIAWTSKADVPPDGIQSRLEERAKVLMAGDSNLAFALEQDPRLIVHIAQGGTKTNDYKMTVQARAGESPAAVRRRCVAALGLPPLSFDPPAELVEFAIPREGAQWQPKAR
ncbi:MAG TPA: ThuA domain-containing protein [Verrucomicrobiae bacterium]|nr:ThuA domain-containing protein [Verrucomicrobiae bacterium]